MSAALVRFLLHYGPDDHPKLTRALDTPPNEQVPPRIIVAASFFLGILATEKAVRSVSRPVRRAAATVVANRQA